MDLPLRCVLAEPGAAWDLVQSGMVAAIAQVSPTAAPVASPRMARFVVGAADEFQRSERIPRNRASPAPAPPASEPESQLAGQPSPPAGGQDPATPISGTLVSVPVATPTPAAPPRVTAIGDSVMLGAVPQLQQALGSVDIDVAVGRQVSGAIEVLRARAAAGMLGKSLVFAVGDNGIFTATEFNSVMALVGDDRRVIFLTVKVPRKWEAPNNAMLADNVKRYKNAVLLDWRAATIDHPELFWDDGIHLRPEGALLYANMIATAVNAQ